MLPVQIFQQWDRVFPRHACPLLKSRNAETLAASLTPSAREVSPARQPCSTSSSEILASLPSRSRICRIERARAGSTPDAFRHVLNRWRGKTRRARRTARSPHGPALRPASKPRDGLRGAQSPRPEPVPQHSPERARKPPPAHLAITAVFRPCFGIPGRSELLAMELPALRDQLLASSVNRAHARDQPFARRLHSRQSAGFHVSRSTRSTALPKCPRALRSPDARGAQRVQASARNIFVRADIDDHPAADRDHWRKHADDEPVSRQHQPGFLQHDARPCGFARLQCGALIQITDLGLHLRRACVKVHRRAVLQWLRRMQKIRAGNREPVTGVNRPASLSTMPRCISTASIPARFTAVRSPACARLRGLPIDLHAAHAQPPALWDIPPLPVPASTRPISAFQ